MGIGSDFVFSGVSVTFTRFFWRENFPSNKNTKKHRFLVGVKTGGGSMSKHPYHSHMRKNAVPSFGSEILSCLPWGNVCSWIVTLKPTLDPYHLGKARVEFVTNDMWNNQTWYLCEPSPSRDFFVGSTVCCFDFRNTTTKLGSKVSESILLCLVAPSRSTTWDVECTVLDGGQQCSGVAGSSWNSCSSHTGRDLFNGRWIWGEAKLLQMGNFTIHGLFFMLLKKLNRSHASTPSWAEICYFIYETNCCCLGCSNVASFPNCKKRHQMATLLGILSTESLGDFLRLLSLCYISVIGSWEKIIWRFCFSPIHFLLSDALWLPCFCPWPEWLGRNENTRLDQLMWWVALGLYLPYNRWGHYWNIAEGFQVAADWRMSMSFSASKKRVQGGPIASLEQETWSVGKKQRQSWTFLLWFLDAFWSEPNNL